MSKAYQDIKPAIQASTLVGLVPPPNEILETQLV